MIGLICVFTLISNTLAVTETERSVNLEPAEADGIEYGNVTLTCLSNDVDIGVTTWYCPDALEGQNVWLENSNCKPEPPFNESKYHWDCSDNRRVVVTLKNLSRYQDNHKWTCQVNLENKSKEATIHVKVPVKVILNRIGTVTVSEDSTIDLNCSTLPSRPPGNISWWLFDTTSAPLEGFKIEKNVTYSTFNQNLTEIWNELTINVNRSHNNIKLYCSGSNIKNVSSSSGMITLNITYPPGKLQIDNYTDDGKFRIIENTVATLQCSVLTGNPQPKLEWSCFQNMETSYENGKVIRRVLISAMRAVNPVYCTCNSNYMENVTSISLIVDVLYPPTRLTFSIKSINVSGETVKLIQNETLNVSCSADSNPTSFYNWTFLNTSSNESIIVISNIQKHHSGRFTCTAYNKMAPTGGVEINKEKSSSFDLDVLYPPDTPVLSYIGNSLNETISRKVYAVKGDSFDIKCSATSNPSPDVIWVNSTTNKIETGIFNVKTISHNITNMCSARNAMIDTLGNVAHGFGNISLDIDVLFPPESLAVYAGASLLPEDIVNISVIENSTLTLRCETISHPFPSYQWTKLGHVVNTSQMYSISKPKRNENIYLECRANNTMKRDPGEVKLGTFSRNFQVDILYPPTILEMNLTVTVVEGNNVSIVCPVKEGNPVRTSVMWKNIYGDRLSNSSKLFLTNVTRNNDSLFWCYALNIMSPSGGEILHGNTSKATHLNVLYKVNVTEFYIKYQSMENEITVNETDTVIFVCEADGNPIASVDLMKGQHNLLANHSHLEYKLQKSSCHDTGTYICIGNNMLFDVHTSHRRQLRLFVNCSPRDYRNITHGKNVTNVTSPQHTSATFSFKAIAHPRPKGLWYRLDVNNTTWENLEMQSGGNLLINSSEDMQYNLTFKNVSQYDFGQYRLMLTNEFGEYEHLFNLNPNEKPNAPVKYGYSEELVTESSIAVWWEPGFNGGFEQHFIVAHKKSSSDKWLNSTPIKDTHGINMSEQINGLESQSLYHILIYAQNFLGSNRIKTEIEVSTKAAVKTPNPSSIVGAAAGGTIGGILALVVIGVVIFVLRKRGLLQKARNDDGGHHEYQNVGFTGELKQSKRLPALPPDEDSEDVHGDHRTIAQQQQQHDYDADEHPYLNTMELIDLMKKVNVSDLFSYVTNKSYQEFSEEFAKFPSGLMVSIPCTIASKPQNAPLNRYQGIYPYDHSRVIISGQPDFFINASYIDGFSGDREYIASLGPTVKHTLGFRTFWNMVWHERSDVIVMLTNLQEPSGMKCEKYWADIGTTRNIGDFTIQSVGEEVAADYKVRTFKVFKDDESRMVTQLHFTAWPDKKVPEDVTSLIEFRQRVKAAPTRSIGPLIVHCSAGVGRTGTYIALDRLIEEGKSKNAINVYDCVMNMRKQRVNMVQTLDQYVYLHQALVYCLVFDIEPVSSRGIDEYVKKTSNNVYSKLFQQLQQTVEDETIEENEARARNGDMLEKNRKTSDIPSDAHRIRLFLDKQMGESDYINAVYLNGFKRLGHFIIAQSPLPTTLDDFVCLLYQANCCCIVSLDDYTQTGASNVTYLPPDNQPMKYGTFTISCSNLDVKSGYSVRKLKLGHTGQFEKGERIVYHFELTGWKHDDRTPKDPKLFVDIVKEVDKYATQLEDEHSHVLVHCMSGSERSGLFCAVYNLIDKMEQERQVSVVNMLRRIRARRRTAIPNMEQLKFCYQALNAFVKSYKI